MQEPFFISLLGSVASASSSRAAGDSGAALHAWTAALSLAESTPKSRARCTRKRPKSDSRHFGKQLNQITRDSHGSSLTTRVQESSC